MPPIDPNKDIDPQIWEQIDLLEDTALLAAMSEAITSLRPDVGWLMNNGDISTIVWDDGYSIPITNDEIRQEMFNLRKMRYEGLQNKENLKISATQKLLDSGLTEEEISALLG